MPFVFPGTRKRRRIVAAAIGLAALAPAPSAQAGGTPVATNPYGCVVDHDLSNPFAMFGDHADYALAPAGDFESRAAGWTLAKASVVAENHPYAIGTTGAWSLRLPASATAVSAPMCIDSRYPHFRVFARNVGKLKSTLKAEVLFLDSKGNIKGTASGTVAATNTSWFPTNSLKIGLTFDTTIAEGAAPVAFRFTAGKESDWRIDDVYVDPYMRR